LKEVDYVSIIDIITKQESHHEYRTSMLTLRAVQAPRILPSEGNPSAEAALE
jgi:hypothetical protein